MNRRRSLSVASVAALLLLFQNCGKFVAQAPTLSSYSNSSSVSVVPTPTLNPQPTPSPGSSSVSSPTPQNSAPLSSGDFVVLVPASNSRVAGPITISGTAGPDVVNVAAYSASGQKVASDVTPSNGTFALSFDTEMVDNGMTTVTVIGFTAAAGQTDGQKLSVFLPLDIENADKPAGTPVASSSGTFGPVTAVSANVFLSSLGVNIHHAQGVPISVYVQPLQYLGVSNIRDDYADPNDFVSLHQQTGVMVDMIIKNNDLTGLLNAGRVMANAGAFLSFEGANEANNFPITYQGQQGGGSGSWAAVAQYQADLFKAAKADPVLKNYPIFSPSETGAETNNVGLQFLTIPQGAGAQSPDGTQFADYANVHNYVSAKDGYPYSDNMAWNAADPLLNTHWDGLFGNFGKTWGQNFAGYTTAQLQTLPRVTTETGWVSSSAADEPTQGVVLLNTYFAQFKRGYRYTFIYMIRDGEGGSPNQGIFHSDSTPKLAATYIHNLTAILADASAMSNPGTLSYGIANEPATMHDLLLQKANGNFELVVWNERASGQNSVTVQLGSSVSSVAVYDPTVGTQPISTQKNVNSIPLTLSDHPQIIEIKR